MLVLHVLLGSDHSIVQVDWEELHQVDDVYLVLRLLQCGILLDQIVEGQEQRCLR